MNAYDVVVIGGGSGSQVATAAASKGLDAAVVEPGPLGGACITRGCVPSKALIHRAAIVDEIERAGRFGIDAELREIDFDAITSTVHDIVYGKAEHQERMLEEMDHLTYYRGRGRFVDDHTIAIDEADGIPAGSEPSSGGNELDRIRADTVVVAVGSRPRIPPIDGLEDVEYLTSDDALFLDEQPATLVIVGGGYIAAELGYFFDAVGTDVSIVGRSDRLVSREDGDVSEAVTHALEDRLEVYTGHEAVAVSPGNDGKSVSLTIDAGDHEPVDLSAEHLLLATGRWPNTDTLALEETSVKTDDDGYVETDEFLKTDAENVWALGDVVGTHPFKHTADYEARCVTTNVLEDSQRPVDYTNLPHAIFTSPQVGSVGRTEAELDDEGVEYESALVTYDAAPLGLILQKPNCFVKVLSEPDGTILGCHVVGPQASTMIHEVVVSLQHGTGMVDDIADTVHVHPALNEVLLAAFDELSARRYSTAPDWRNASDR